MTRILTLQKCRGGKPYKFVIKATGQRAQWTKRERHSVFCEECSRDVHINTVDPDAWADSHFKHSHLHAKRPSDSEGDE